MAEPAGFPFAAIAFGPTPTCSVVAGGSVGYPLIPPQGVSPSKVAPSPDPPNYEYVAVFTEFVARYAVTVPDVK